MAQPMAFRKPIPIEIFNKVIFHCDEETLRNITSRVCSRWRALSHRTDPEEGEDIYDDVHTPMCTDIGGSVRNLRIINFREVTSEPNGPGMVSTTLGTLRFCGFLHQHSSLELVGFGHYFLDWATVPSDVMNALAEISNIRKLVMRAVTLPVSHPYAAPLNPPCIQLDLLALYGSKTIYNFTSFLLSNHGAATQWLSSLSSIELHFEEAFRQWPSSIRVAQVLLDNFATSATEFVLGVSLPKAIHYYPILSSPLHVLASVEHLKTTLIINDTLFANGRSLTSKRPLTPSSTTPDTRHLSMTSHQAQYQ